LRRRSDSSSERLRRGKTRRDGRLKKLLGKRGGRESARKSSAEIGSAVSAAIRRGSWKRNVRRSVSVNVRVEEKGNGAASGTESATVIVTGIVNAVMTATVALRGIVQETGIVEERGTEIEVGIGEIAATADRSLLPKVKQMRLRRSSPKRITNGSSKKLWRISFGKASASPRSSPS